MFKAPFSFKGRIRRKEFGFTFLIYISVVILIYSMILGFAYAGSGIGVGVMALLLFILFIPLIWFMWAQGAKRCHDMGKSGLYQLIPFYVLIMLFQDGERRMNQYGQDPKFPEDQQFSFEESNVYRG